MPTAIWIDGALGGADAGVSALDAGFLHGDSVFETLRALGGRAVDLDAHLDRLAAGARAIELAAPPMGEIRGAIVETVAAAGDRDLRVRAIVTRGRSDLAAARPTLVITAEPCAPLAPAPAPLVLALVDRPLSDARTIDPSLKTGSYLPSLLALRAARAAGADEAVRLTLAGIVAEGATSNLFAVIDGALVTPPGALGIRAGVTRARVIELARGDARELAFAPAELARATEIFVTSSIRGVAPVARLIGADAAAWDAPGPWTQKIAEAYLAFASRGAG